MKRKLGDVDFLQLVNRYDIILFSETWLSDSDNSNLEIQGYKCEHIHGNKSAGVRKGRYSGGISIYYKNCFSGQIKIIEKIQCGIMWIKLQSDLFNFDEDVYICNVYIPPSGSKVLNSQDVDIFECLEQGLLNYKNRGKVFISGDFNSRTSTESDYLDFDKYLDDDFFIENFNSTHSTTRVNKDHVIDSYGRRLLLFCHVTDLHIANGRLGNDRGVGQFTFVSHTGLSVVDYLLCSDADSKYVENFSVLQVNEFSDHSPVMYALASKYMAERTIYPETSNTNDNKFQKIIYDETKVPMFRQQLLNCQGVLNQLIDDVNIGQIDCIVQSFTNVLYESTSEVFGHKKYGRSNRSPTKLAKSPWFDDKCTEARTNFKRARNIFSKHKNDMNRQHFITARNKYNKIKRLSKLKYKQKIGREVSDMAKKETKRFLEID